MLCRSDSADESCKPRAYYLCRYILGLLIALLWIFSGPVIPGILAAASCGFSFTVAFRSILGKFGLNDADSCKKLTSGFRDSSFLIFVISLCLFFCSLKNSGNVFSISSFISGISSSISGLFDLSFFASGFCNMNFSGNSESLCTELLFLSAVTIVIALTDFRNLSAFISGKPIRLLFSEDNDGRMDFSGNNSNNNSGNSFNNSGSNFCNRSGKVSILLTAMRFLIVIASGVIVMLLSGCDIHEMFSGSFSGTISGILFIAVIVSFGMSLAEEIRGFPSRHASYFSGILLTSFVFIFFGCAFPLEDIAVAFVFPLILGILAYVARVGDFSSLIASTLLGFVITLYTSPAHYVLVLMFFIIGSICTKYKYSYKEKLGLAEGKKGMRTYVNVFANSLSSLVWAVACGVCLRNGDACGLFIPFTFAFVGTVANALADTMASEIGTTYKGNAYLITTFKKAKTGEDGGVSLLGEVACLAGSVIIGIFAFAFGIIDSLPVAVLVGIAGGFIGTNIDSILGATLQKNGYLSNSGVNLLSTAISGFPAAAVWIFVMRFRIDS